MRKQKTGLHKDIGAIFQDAVISENVNRPKVQGQDTDREVPLPSTVGTGTEGVNSTDAESQPSLADKGVAIEEKSFVSDISLDESACEEPRVEVDKPPSTPSKIEESVEDQEEISGFKRFLRLFTE